MHSELVIANSTAAAGRAEASSEMVHKSEALHSEMKSEALKSEMKSEMKSEAHSEALHSEASSEAAAPLA